MGQRDHVANEAEIPEGTLVELFLEAVDRYREQAAFRYFDGSEWRSISYAEGFDRSRGVAEALWAKGIEPGERVAILSENRPEWAMADYGCLMAGVSDVPIYATLTPHQIAYIVRDSGARLAFASTREQMDKLLQVREEVESLETIVVFDPPGEMPDGVVSWDDFLQSGRDQGEAVSDDEFRKRVERTRPDDVATILYTSGTTGDPKGVMLTHNNLASNVRAASEIIRIDESDDTLSFLPLSHVFQRMVDYLLLAHGCTIAYARSIDTVPEDLRTIKPTVVVSVPRLYEKVYAKVTDATGVKGKLVGWAQGVGERAADVRLAGGEPGGFLALQYKLADALVFKKIRQGVGGRLRYFVSGGAPLSPEINKFFFAAGVLILEGYGLTETSPVTNVNPPERIKIGTVGPPVPGTEIRIAEDGEILVRGPQIMKGYLDRPEDTAEVLTEDGWFHTGDIGELDEEGYLRITDRKKDIIVTAGGKNVAPQSIENRLKTNRYIDQPVLVGDRRKFLSLLLVPDFGALEAWAREQGVEAGERRELLANPRVHQMLESEVVGELEDYARFEVPKRIVLLDEPFTIEDGSLTPTQKVKRRVVEKRLEDVIEGLYAEDGPTETVVVAEGAGASRAEAPAD